MSQQQLRKPINLGYVLALGTELGFLIAFPLVFCVIIGVALDRKLNTFPWIMLAMIFVGIGLTVIDVYKVVIPFLEKRSVNNKQDNIK